MINRDEVKKEMDEKIQRAESTFASENYTEAARFYREVVAAANEHIFPEYYQYDAKRQLANELASWKEMIDKTTVAAQKDLEAGKAPKAHDDLNRLLNSIPTDPPSYLKLRRKAEAVRAAAQSEIGDEGLYQSALETRTNGDYGEAVRIAQAISPVSQRYSAAQTLIQNCKTKQNENRAIEDGAKKAMSEGRFADVFSLFTGMKADFPKNQLWRKYWLEAGTKGGQAERKAGEACLIEDEFSKARRCFSKSKNMQTKVLEAYPDHLDALNQSEELSDLEALTSFAETAQKHLEARHFHEARNELKAAQMRLAEAKQNGRDYLVMESRIASMLNKATDAIAGANAAKVALQTAGQALAEQDLQMAEDNFTIAAQSSNLDIQTQALEGQKKVAQEQKRFKIAVTTGERTSDPAEAAKHYKEALSIWRDHPQAKKRLIKALESALTAAEQNNNQSVMENLARELLEVDPDNKRAGAILDRLDIEPRVDGIVKAANELLKQPAVERIQLRERKTEIESLLFRTSNHPQLQARLNFALEEINLLLETLQKVESAVQAAEAQIQTGDWEGGVAAYQAALDTLGERAPANWRVSLEKNLRPAKQAVQEARKAAPLALERAQKAYAECFERDTLAEIENALSATEKGLKNVADTIKLVPAQLPNDLADLQKEADNLRKRFELIRDARQTNEPRKSLSKLRGGVQVLGGEVDPVLAKFLHDMEEKLKAEIPQMISEAREALLRGRFQEAEENLRLARQIDPQHPEIAKEQSRLTKLKNLSEEIGSARANAESKANSPTEKQKALKEGLNVFRLAPSELLGEELPEKITQLLRLGDDPLALSDVKNYERAKGLIDDFRKATDAPNWAIREAAGYADDWLKLAQKNALEGVRESAAALGDLLGAYRAAKQLLEREGTNTQTSSYHAQALEALINQQTQSAQKRYDWAKEAFVEGDFGLALQDLAAIEEQFFKPVEAEFSRLFENVPQVEEMRKSIRSLQREIEKGQKAKEIVQPILDAARDLFYKNEFKRAEEKLDELERHDIDPAARAWKEATALRERIQKARAQAETKKLDGLLTEMESAFSIAFPDDYVTLQKRFDDETKLIDFTILSAGAEVKSRYENLRAKISTGLINYRQHAQYMNAGAQALEVKEYEKAAGLFRQALDTAPDDQSRTTAEIKLKQVEEHGRAQSALKGALENAHNLLSSEQYESARTEFEKISDFGGEWEAVAEQGSALARAGIWYLQAKANGEAGRLDEAQSAIETAQTLADQWQELKASDTHAARRRSAARTVKEKIDVLSRNIQTRDQSEKSKQQRLAEVTQQAEAAAQARRAKLLQAQSELNQYRYSSAKEIAEGILLEDPNNAEAKTVWDAAVKGLAQEGQRKKLQAAAASLLQKDYIVAKSIADEVLIADPDNQDAKAISSLVAANKLRDDGSVQNAVEEARKIDQDKISIPDIKAAIKDFVSRLSEAEKRYLREEEIRRKAELDEATRKAEAEHAQAEAERAQKFSASINEIVLLQATWQLSSSAAQLRAAEELVKSPADGITLEDVKNKQVDQERKYALLKSHLDSYHAASAWTEKIDALKRARVSAPDHPEVVEAVAQSHDKLIAGGKSALEKDLFAEAKLLGEYAKELNHSGQVAELLEAVKRALNEFLNESRKSAWAAIRCWNVEAAEKYQTDIRTHAPKDASLETLKQRATDILEKAKPTHVALKEGWAALRTADFVAAQEKFKEAERRASDDDLTEIATWLKFTSELQFAKESFANGEFQSARNALQAAAKVVTPVKNELPSVFGGINAIFALRQSAREGVEQALQIVVEIIRNYNEWKRFDSSGDEDGALRCIREIKGSKESFVQSLNLSLRMSGSTSEDEKAYEEKNDANGKTDGQERKTEESYEDKSGNISDAQGIGLAGFSAAVFNDTEDSNDDNVPTSPIAPSPDKPDNSVAPPSRVLSSYDMSTEFPSENSEKPISPQASLDKNSDSVESSGFSWGAPKLNDYEE